MIDELALGLGQHRIVGCPFHGLVRGNRLTLPNGQHIDNRWFADSVRGSYRFAVPGVPAVSRTPADAARDAAAGYQWRTDAVINLWNNTPSLTLYGRRSFNGHALYAVAPGNCWAVRLPFDMTPNTGKTQLLNQATWSRFGWLNFTGEADDRALSVGLAGYVPGDIFSSPVSDPRLWDSLPDGSKVILGGTQFDATHELYQPSSTAGFDLLRITGNGTAGSPFTAVLERLSGVRSGVESRTDTFTTTTGVLTWAATASTEWIDALDNQSPSPCKWLKHTVTGSTMAIDPNGIPSPVTPAVSFVSGVREAALVDQVIGYWFAPNDTPQPVTLSLGYRLEADYTASGSSVAEINRELVQRYTGSGGSNCGPQTLPGDDVYDIEGEFTWSGSMQQLTRERLTWQLKVGGALIDESELIYEDIFTSELSGTAPGYDNNGNLSPSTDTVQSSTWVRRLVADGEVIDSVTDAGSHDGALFGVTAFTPGRTFDDSNRFMGSDPVSYWLPITAGSLHGMPVGIRTKVWACDAHWWSNDLVCLLRRLRPYPGSAGQSLNYGVTAYPGGVTSSPIAVPAPSPTISASPRYGARSPFTGELLLGQTTKVTFV